MCVPEGTMCVSDAALCVVGGATGGVLYSARAQVPVSGGVFHRIRYRPLKELG
jgi:hypothetical protein